MSFGTCRALPSVNMLNLVLEMIGLTNVWLGLSAVIVDAFYEAC